MSLVQASGVVPAWLGGGAALEVLSTGGKPGYYCFSAIFFRVCYAVVRGLYVIFIFFVGSPSNFTHRLMKLHFTCSKKKHRLKVRYKFRYKF
jgi:hypothetical protein